MVLPYLYLLIAPKVWTFDRSFRASCLMLLQLNLMFLDLATKLAVLAGMWNLLNHLIGKGVCSIFSHRSSAGWTSCHIHPAGLAHYMAHGTRGYWDFSGDLKTNRALELTQEALKSCSHYLLS